MADSTRSQPRPERGPWALLSQGHRPLDAEALRVQLRRGGQARLRIEGRSMRPLLPPGSRVTLRATKRGEELCGCLVAMEVGNRVVVHRVVADDGAYLTTKGLLTRQLDTPTGRQQVLGVVSGRSGCWLRSELQLKYAGSAIAFMASLFHRVKA